MCYFILYALLVLMVVRKTQPAHYTLKYNVMPYVGVLTYGEAARTNTPLEFPPVQKHV